MAARILPFRPECRTEAAAERRQVAAIVAAASEAPALSADVAALLEDPAARQVIRAAVRALLQERAYGAGGAR